MGMPVRTDRRRRWTPAAVRELRERSVDATRYEVVGGELLVTPAPGGAHQNAVVVLCAALYRYVRTQRVGHASVAPRDVELPSEDSLIQPDVLVVPYEDAKLFVDSRAVERLLLAVEVLSAASAHADRVTKRRLLQRNRVPEYWVVDVEARVVERWRPDDERPEILTERLEWLPPGASEPFVLDLGPYFAEVLAEDL